MSWKVLWTQLDSVIYLCQLWMRQEALLILVGLSHISGALAGTAQSWSTWSLSLQQASWARAEEESAPVPALREHLVL